MSQAFRADVEGLRAVAVLPILAFHLDPALCPGGYIGVDIFFVISGYVVTRMIAGEGASFRLSRFYVRRFFRIFPALLATVGVTLAAAWEIAAPGHYTALALSALAAVLALSNVYFYATAGYFAGEALEHPLLHTWSLGVEEQFYLVWPALLLAAGQARRRTWLAAAAAASLAAAIVCQPLDPDLAFYMMPFRIFEFAGGALLADDRLAARLGAAPRNGLGLAGALLVAAALAGFDAETPWPGWPTVLPAAGTMLLIVAGAGGFWQALLALAPLRFVGRISYALYLVHWPVITLSRAQLVVEPAAADLIAMGGATLALAVALHYAVEAPFRIRSATMAGAAERRGGLRWRGAGAGLGLALTTAFAGAVIAAGGFPARVGRTQAVGETLTFAGDLCDAKQSRCVFGDRHARETVYLVGDSHALNLLYGLDALFRAQGIKGIALYNHGCLHLAGTVRFLRGARDERCAADIARAYALLEREAHAVVLAGAWGGYASVIGPADAAAPLRHATKQDYYTWLAAQMKASLRRLRPEARPVILIKQGYNTGVDLAKCLAQPGARAETCTPRPRAEAFRAAAPADAAIDAQRVAFPSLTVIDPKAAFCAAGASCTARDGETLYFRDKEHLTNAGSAFLVRRIAEELLAAIRRPRS